MVLIESLKNKRPDKTSWMAEFVCSLVVVNSDLELHFEGRCQGEIRDYKSGNGGFGYDPIFYLPDGRSMSELSSDEKNTISHRALAMSALLNHVEFQNFCGFTRS